MKKLTHFAFTLVELIVVITILAILGTIAFISLQGYSSTSRDSVRISDIGNIAKMLELSMVKGEKVPKPESSIELSASGVLLAYQGVAGEKNLGVLGVSNGGKDPLEDTYYTYTTNANLTKYQIMGFLEDGGQVGFSMGKDRVESKDLSNRRIYIRGDELGILLEGTTSNPVDRLGADVDVLNTTEEYKAVFNEEVIVTGTGEDLFSDYYNRSSELLNNDEFAQFDENLVLFMDMETTTMSGSSVVLKDLSKYGNNGSCYNSGVLVDCGGPSGPQFIYGGVGKAMIFDGIDDWVGIPDSVSLSPSNAITMVGLYKTNTQKNGKGFITKGVYGAGTSDYDYMFYTTGLNYNLPELMTYYKDKFNISNYIGKSFNYADGKFHMLTATIDTENDFIKLYDNKYNIHTVKGNYPEIRDSNNPLKFMHGWNGFSDAELSEVRIYNRVLSEAEIKILYDAMK